MTHQWYAIRVGGRLPSDWSNWFEGLAIEPAPGGGSVLRGPLADQAALHGVLAKIRDLNLTLVAVNRCPPREASEGKAAHGA